MKKRLTAMIFLFSCFCVLFTGGIVSAEVDFTQQDRERMIRLEVSLQDLKETMKLRFEQVDQRFSLVDKQFEQMMDFFKILSAIFTALVAAILGFGYWDRRSSIRTAKNETIAEIEKDGRLVELLKVMRELAKTDPKVAEALRQFHLL